MSLPKLFLCSVLITLIGAYIRRRRSKLPLPPGPPGLPFFGNIFDGSKSEPWIVYNKWSREYGSDLIHVNMAGTSVIVIDSDKAAHDLFVKRSAIYSDRARAVMLNELIGFDWMFAFMPYGSAWRERRRLFHGSFRANAIPQYRSKIAQVSKEFLFNHINQPVEDPTEHLSLMTGSLILSLVCGQVIHDKEDARLQAAEKAMHAISAAGGPGSFLVDFMPLLKHIPSWMPGAKFKSDALLWRKTATETAEYPYEAVKKDLENEIPNSSITASLLRNVKESPDRARLEMVISQTMGVVYTGGSHTIVATLQGFFLAMLLFPDVLRRGQKEIDVVVGTERLPTLEDQMSLPYVSAIVKEVLRWRPIVPLVPHRVTVEDSYAGYRIPTGAIVVGNAWSILHDESAYPNPETFSPERFLTSEGGLNPNVREPDAAFGFGRRICPGRYLAWESVWTTVSMVLATLDIEKAVDKQGNVMQVTGEYSKGLLQHPLPFRCSIKPRSAAAEALIRTSVCELGEYDRRA